MAKDSKKNKLREKKYATLRGIGRFYGHVVKVELAAVNLDLGLAEIKLKDGTIIRYGKNGLPLSIRGIIDYSTYQLDWDSVVNQPSITENLHFYELR